MKVTVRKNTLYFDEEATALIKLVARRKHQSFKTTVIRALRAGVKRAKTEAAQRVVA